MSYSVPPLPSRPVPREVFTDPVLTQYRRAGNSRLVYDKKRRTIIVVRTPWWRRLIRKLVRF